MIVRTGGFGVQFVGLSTGVCVLKPAPRLLDAARAGSGSHA